MGAADALRRFKPTDEANVAAYSQQQLQASAAAQDEIRTKSRQLSIDLIQDNRARGEAQISADINALTQRLALESQSGEDRKRITADLAAYQVLRQEQLAEEMKPAWQKLVAGWSDTTRLMRDANDEMMSGLLKNGEDAFVELGRTGKLNVRKLVDDMNAQFLRVQFRKMIGEAAGGESGSSLVSQLLNGTSVKGYSGQEGSANFMGPLQSSGSEGGTSGAIQSIGLAGKAASELASNAGASASALSAQTSVVTQAGAAQQLVTSLTQAASAAESTATATSVASDGAAALAADTLASSAYTASLALMEMANLVGDGLVIALVCALEPLRKGAGRQADFPGNADLSCTGSQDGSHCVTHGAVQFWAGCKVVRCVHDIPMCEVPRLPLALPRMTS